MARAAPVTNTMAWAELPGETRELLRGKLAGLWGEPTDADAFDSWPLDKKQGMLLLLRRMNTKGLWRFVKQVTNIYGEGGVGLRFLAWPMILSTLVRRRDFTRLFANHHDTTGGFYEKQRPRGILHFLYQDGDPRLWYVHFDLYSPVHSPASALRHLYFESLRNLRPDWRTIAECLDH